MPQLTFKRNAHISYFKRCLTLLPSSAEGHDGNRITIAYFCLSALDLLGALNDIFTDQEKNQWIRWVWDLQAKNGGFKGSTFMTSSKPELSASEYDPGHLPSTYTALLILGILRAPREEWIEKLDINGLDIFLDTCADANGSFSPIPLKSPDPGSSPLAETCYAPPFQSDVRMAYCASVLNDMIMRVRNPSLFENPIHPASINVESSSDRKIRDSPTENAFTPASPKQRSVSRTKAWLSKCQTWEGGFGQHPGLEAQGGTTYCAIASLRLMQPDPGAEWSDRLDIAAATRYLVSRQLSGSSKPADQDGTERSSGSGGFQGRPGKDEDVCYSFWCGGAVRILLNAPRFDTEANTRALLNSQSPIGGFGKARGEFPDPYHSYLALAALAMNENDADSSAEVLQGGEIRDTPYLAGTPEGTLEATPTPIPKLGLRPLDPLWNVSTETRAYIQDCLEGIRYCKNRAGLEQ